MATKKNAAAVQAATEDEAMTTAEVSTQADEQEDEVAEPILLDNTFKDTMNQTNALLAAIAGQNYRSPAGKPCRTSSGWALLLACSLWAICSRSARVPKP